MTPAALSLLAAACARRLLAAGSRRSIRRAAGRAASRGCSGSSPASARSSGSLVMIALVVALCARRRGQRADPLAAPTARASGARSVVVGGASASTVADRCSCCSSASASSPAARSPRSARAERAHHRASPATSGGGRCATRTPSPSRSFTTANEIHIPVGRPVQLELRVRRRDPQLLGAEPARQARPDPRPRRTTIWLQADQPGVYRGQCAEFCGAAARAHGASSSSPSRRTTFDAWLTQQLAAAAPQPTDAERAARAATCSCRRRCVDVPHDPRHAGAAARVGPDLTHVASRATHRRRHAARSRRGNLAGWIADPQAHQAGRPHAADAARAPTTCNALVAYLESLK